MRNKRISVFVLALSALMAEAAPSASSQAGPEKKLKQGEYEIYNDVVKDVNTGNFTKAIADLDAWKAKFPDSEYKDDRLAFYVQAYAGANQAAKSLAAATELLSRDLNATFPGPAGQPTVIRVLYSTVWAVSHDPNPAPDELAAGERAARQLMAYDQKLPGVTDAQWAQVRTDMREKAGAALLYEAMLPGLQAMAKQPPDCAAADSAYARALGDYPDKSILSYELGRAASCQTKTQPERISLALYEFERAAVIDPTLDDPTSDPKKIQTFADNSYIKVHGSDEGLDRLKQQVKESPLPPAGFKIKTAAEIAEEKRAELEKSNPQLALWMKIKGALSDTDGDQYFVSQLKDSAVPQLRGTLLEAKPACRPTELLVAVPLPDSAQTLRPEIQLKFEKPLTGRPETNTEFYWEGVPSAFTRDPFLLTMDTEASKIEGLKTMPCAPATTKKK